METRELVSRIRPLLFTLFGCNQEIKSHEDKLQANIAILQYNTATSVINPTIES